MNLGGQLRGRNVIIAVPNREKKNIGTKADPVLVDQDSLVYPTATIVAIGHKAELEPEVVVGMKIMVFAQSLAYKIDNEDFPEVVADKANNYYMIFDEQIEFIFSEGEDAL